ncbi:DUF6270 domain-containing protein [Terrabacter sp. GCM10028922]|uniref:DUF6270 domain-containing protein n=1 Tax=Terrabacter sp. GCM10028922 TaxID=3273428 RepID=UPI00361D4A37
MTPPAPAPRRVRTLVHGSCVSRDTFEFLDPKAFELTAYVARQSLISAMGATAPAPVCLARLDSPFQRRMLAGDAASSLPGVMRKLAAEVDLVVLDLFDERLGVFEHLDGSFTTDSVELRTLGEEGLTAGSMHHRFGSRVHRRFFQTALEAFRTLLDDLDLRDRTVLLAPKWAPSNRDGGEPTPSFGDRADAMNPVFDHYVDAAVHALDVPVLGKDVQTYAEPEHRWGSAPFHYDDDTYTALAAEVAEAAPGTPKRAPVRVTTLRRVGSQPVVTLRQVGPGQIVATTRAHDATAFAFHLYAGTEQVQKVHYRRSPTHMFDVTGRGSGPFHVRAFVKDSTGGRTPVVSERLRLTRWPSQGGNMLETVHAPSPAQRT